MIAGLVMLAAFSAVPAFGNTITVTNNSDSGPGSLRDAIAGASSGDTINFSLTLPATITLTSGPLSISKNLRISGPGASSLAISGNNSVQVFNIGGGFTVSISGLTIENGSTGGNGGGIYNSSTLIVSDSTVSHNQAGASFGGGIYNIGTLIVTSSTLAANSASNGGGIFNDTGATAALTNSTLSGNSATYAGGIFNNTGAAATLTNSTLSGNNGAIVGGGINNVGTLNVTNSTFFGNSSSSYPGGGIYNAGGTLNVSSSTFSGNSRGQIWDNGGATIVKNSIVASSPGGNCAPGGGTITSKGYNLSDDATCSTFFNQTGDLNNTAAGLDPNGLQNNGGPTQTIALLAASPALDAVPLNPTNYCTDVNGASVNTDQRGDTRPQGPACDIGAFEFPDNDSQFSRLNGGNAFSGNQTVNGNVAATNFVGNGSGLTGVNADALGGVRAANYARLDLSNTFSATQRINNNLDVIGTVNALSLNVGVGGVVINPGNLFTFGVLNTLGPLQIGSSGTPIIKHLSQTLSLNVAGLGPATCAPLQPFTLTGASDGDSLALGVPNSLLNSNFTGAGILNYSAWVSATNTITIRVCNLNPNGPKSTAVSGTIRVDVWKH